VRRRSEPPLGVRPAYFAFSIRSETENDIVLPGSSEIGHFSTAQLD
jgi:hypothetical protein